MGQVPEPLLRLRVLILGKPQTHTRPAGSGLQAPGQRETRRCEEPRAGQEESSARFWSGTSCRLLREGPGPARAAPALVWPPTDPRVPVLSGWLCWSCRSPEQLISTRCHLQGTHQDGQELGEGALAGWFPTPKPVPASRRGLRRRPQEQGPPQARPDGGAHAASAWSHVAGAGVCGRESQLRGCSMGPPLGHQQLVRAQARGARVGLAPSRADARLCYRLWAPNGLQPDTLFAGTEASVCTSPGFQLSPVQHSLATEAQPVPPTPHRSAPDIYPWTEPRPASCPSPLQVAVPRDPPPPARSAWKVWPALEALCHKHRGWGWPERACSPPTAQTQKLRKTAAGGGRQGCGDAAAVGPRGFSWCRGRNPDTEDRSITYLEDRQSGGVSWAPSSGWTHLSDVSPPPAPRAGPDQLRLPGLTP